MIGLVPGARPVPDRLVVHAVETADFGYGIGLVPPSRQPPKRSLSAVLRDLAAD